MLIVHGEQRLECYKQLKPLTKYLTKSGVHDIVDKGKGFLITLEMKSYEILENGKEELACANY